MQRKGVKYMQLITKELQAKLPPLYACEDKKDPIVICKFFAPWTNWTWYAIEFDGEDRFFGYVVGHDNELGYFSLSELQWIEGPFGLKIERDLYFDPKPLSEIKRQH